MTSDNDKVMADIENLIMRLRSAGIDFTDEIAEAMLSTPIEMFSDHDHRAFYHDRPLVFLETEDGGVKTISAPHMIVTLLHHLEIRTNQEIVILGAKGGYLATLIAHIVGPKGKVVIVDPSTEVIEYVNSRLDDSICITCTHMESVDQKPKGLPSSMHRVLVTGQIESLPEWLSEHLVEGGFAIAPIGEREYQNLMKLERQGGEIMETGLGQVIFGPVDIKESIPETPSPEAFAFMIEDALEALDNLEMIDVETRHELDDLIADLRLLPDDLAPPKGEADEEHPMISLLLDKGGLLMSLWPLIQLMSDNRLAHPASPDADLMRGGHEDLIP